MGSFLGQRVRRPCRNAMTSRQSLMGYVADDQKLASCSTAVGPLNHWGVANLYMSSASRLLQRGTGRWKMENHMLKPGTTATERQCCGHPALVEQPKGLTQLQISHEGKREDRKEWLDECII